MKTPLRFKWTTLAVILLSLFSLSSFAQQDAFYINSTSGDDGNDGLTAESAWATLDKFLVESTAGGAYAAQAEYNVHISGEVYIYNYTLSGEGKTYNFYGEGPKNTFIKPFADLEDVAFTKDAQGITLNTSLNLFDLTVSDFDATASIKNGGFIKVNELGKFSASRVNFLNNKVGAASGGAIYSIGSIVIENSYFEGNEANNVGSAIQANNGVVDISNTTFYKNMLDGQDVWKNGSINFLAYANSTLDIRFVNNTVYQNSRKTPVGEKANGVMGVSISDGNETGSKIKRIVFANNLIYNPISGFSQDLTWPNRASLDSYEEFVVTNNAIKSANNNSTDVLSNSIVGGTFDINAIHLSATSIETADGLKYLAIEDEASLLVNAGSDTYAPEFDALGATRSDVSDIGAFEFGGTFPNQDKLVEISLNTDYAVFNDTEHMLDLTFESEGMVLETIAHTITFNGGSELPKAVGVYDVVVEVTEEGYTGSLTTKFVVAEKLTSFNAAYYIDAENGSTANDGSMENPWKSFDYAMFKLEDAVNVKIYTKGDFTVGSYEIKGGTNISIQNWDGVTSFEGSGSKRFFTVNGTLKTTGVTFQNFLTDEGGSIAQVGGNGKFIVDQCNFINNSVLLDPETTINGGAILTSGVLVVSNSYFSENKAHNQGSAIAVNSGDFILFNSTFFRNSTVNAGGAIAIVSNANRDTNINITNNTIVSNYSANKVNGASGILFKKNAATNINILNFTNNLLFGYYHTFSANWQTDLHAQTADELPADLVTFNNNIFTNVNDNVPYVDGFQGNIRIASAPGSLINIETVPVMNANGVYYLPLKETSNAIDAGNNEFGVLNDITGSVASGTARDIGAFEYNGTPAKVATININSPLEVDFNDAEQLLTFEFKDGETTITPGYNVTYNGVQEAPFNAGTYTVDVMINDAEYVGRAEALFTINKIEGAIAFDETSLTAEYTGEAIEPTVISDQNYTIVYRDAEGAVLEGAPVEIGTYSVEASINSTNYFGSVEGILIIESAVAEKTPLIITPVITSVEYNTEAQIPTFAIKNQEGVEIDVNTTISYDGKEESPINAGTYEVVVTINDILYSGTSTFDFTIDKAYIDFNYDESGLIYNGEVQKPRVWASYSSNDKEFTDFTVNVTEGDGMSAGEHRYSVFANDLSNHFGSVSRSYIISKATANLTLSTLSYTFDGTAKEATVTSDVEGLKIDVTYDGSADAPLAVGSYDVVATVVDMNYQGSAEGVLTITEVEVPDMEITIEQTLTSTVYNGSPQAVSFTTKDAEGNDVEVATTVTYNNEQTVPTNAGVYSVVVNVTEEGYTGGALFNFTIEKAVAVVTITDTEFDFDETAKSVTVTSDVEGLQIDVTYDGSADAPSAVGSYEVIATVVDDNYEGSATATLVINPAAPTSIDQNTLSVNVYPNPSNGVFTVELGNATSAEMIVTSLSGVEILSENVVNKKVVTLPSSANGVVIVTLISGDQVTSSKVIIK